MTAYDRDEMFATGDYPNQAADSDGLPIYAQAGRPLVDTDVVVWYTFGTNHVVRPEDSPGDAGASDRLQADPGRILRW